MERQIEPPLTTELLDRAAKSGDPFTMFETLVNAPFVDVEFDHQFARLHRLIRRRCKDDPLGFAQQIIAQGLSTVSYMVMRTGYYVCQMIPQYDARFNRRPGIHLPPDAIALLPKLIELNEHLLIMAEGQARLARQIELARAKKLDNDLTESLMPHKAPIAANQRARGNVPVVNGHANAETKTLANGKANGHSNAANGHVANGHTANGVATTNRRARIFN